MLLEYSEEHDVGTTGEMAVRVETAASPPPKQTIRRNEEELGLGSVAGTASSVE